MKGGRSGGRLISRAMTQRKNNQSNVGAGAAALGAGALAGSGGGVSTPVLTSCPPEDRTFMCKLTRFYNSFKMILGIITTVILIGVAIWLAYVWYKSRR